jgi:predicted anti-sigma-YlaC factor YlaD
MHPSGQTISDFVDGELRPAERAEVQHHLDVCAECAALAADFKGLTRAASRLEPLTPPAPVWDHVAAAVQRDRSRSSYARWTWLAAAAALVLAIGYAVRWSAAPPVAVDSSSGPIAANVQLLEIERQYDAAFKDLEQIARAERALLDESAGVTIDQSLALVDKAIDESRAAVAEEPGSEPAQHSLLESFRMKLALLQDTVALINQLRKTQPVDAPTGASGS